MYVCLFRCLDNLLVGCTGSAVSNIFSYCTVKEEHTLGNHTDAATEAWNCNITDIVSVKKYSTGGYIIKPWNQVTKSGFSTARRSNESESFSRLDREVEVGNNKLFTIFRIGRVTEGNVVKLNITANLIKLNCAVINLVLLIHNIVESCETTHTLLKLLKERNKSVDGVHKHGN